MTRSLQVIITISLLAASAAAAYGVVAMTVASRVAASDPALALRWQPSDPAARHAIASKQMSAGQTPAAVADMRQLLAIEPLQGDAFALLAAAVRTEPAQRAFAQQQVAARRAPLDPQARVWLLREDLKSRRFADALRQFSLIIKAAPAYGRELVPAMASMTADPGFADAMVSALASSPPWRKSMLGLLQKDTDNKGAGHVLGALQRQGRLDEGEYGSWLDQLMRQGRWGEAYGRWAGSLALHNGVLPSVYNGGFDTTPSSIGFDWRVLSIPGVLLDFVPDQGATGLVAHATFLGRSIDRVNLEQPLLLMPGSYRLTARMRAELLRSDSGLEWTVGCVRGGKKVLASSERVQGSFGWRTVQMDFQVPEGDPCAGQWLRLRNPVPKGFGQRVSGDLWIDDVFIERLVR